jgi:hypothetical protein
MGGVSLDNVSRADWVLVALAVLLVVDLLFLPWISVSVGRASESATATGAPNGVLGILAVLSTIALIADLAIERFLPTIPVPNLGAGRADTRLVLATMTTCFLALKLVLHLGHLGYLAFGFWVALVATAGLVYVAWQCATGRAPSRQRVR